MSKKKKSKNVDKPRDKRPIPPCVPSTARYVNMTELDDHILVKCAKQSVSTWTRLLFALTGIALIVAGIVYHMYFNGGSTVSLLVGIAGVMLIIQEPRLARELALRNKRELAKAGEDAFHRLVWFTNENMGFLDVDGSTHTIPLKLLAWIKTDDELIYLKITSASGVYGLSRDGFARGNANEFIESMKNRLSTEE